MAIDVRLAFDIFGTRKRFLTLKLNNSGSLIIPFHASKESSPIFKHTSTGDQRSFSSESAIKAQKYSVHPSTHLPENVIHWTQITERGTKFDRRIYTKAIKNKRRFALLHYYMLHSLEGAPDANEKHATAVSLAEYDPKQFSIFYALHIADQDCEFLRTPDDFNVFQYVIGEYRIVILWCFIHVPAYDGGI
jgi:hypothetical protein